MVSQLPFVRWTLLVATIGLMLSAGCEIVEPPEFETYEIDFQDSVTLPAPAADLVIVLEQLPDGPIEKFRDVSHEVRAVDHLADSLVVHLDVVGLATEPTPHIYTDTRQVGDTLFIWYADHSRIEASPAPAKNAVLAKTSTTPPEPYLKVTHVEIEAPPAIDVRFLNRFIP